MILCNAYHNCVCTYGTAQLQGNIQMHLKRVQDTSGMHEWDASGMCTRRIRTSAKPHDKAAVRRTWVPHPFFARQGYIQNAYRACVRHVWNMCRMCLGRVRINVTSELSCTIDTITCILKMLLICTQKVNYMYYVCIL